MLMIYPYERGHDDQCVLEQEKREGCSQPLPDYVGSLTLN
jgi:hypothetical protein